MSRSGRAAPASAGSLRATLCACALPTRARARSPARRSPELAGNAPAPCPSAAHASSPASNRGARRRAAFLRATFIAPAAAARTQSNEYGRADDSQRDEKTKPPLRSMHVHVEGAGQNLARRLHLNPDAVRPGLGNSYGKDETRAVACVHVRHSAHSDRARSGADGRGRWCRRDRARETSPVRPSTQCPWDADG